MFFISNKHHKRHSGSLLLQPSFRKPCFYSKGFILHKPSSNSDWHRPYVSFRTMNVLSATAIALQWVHDACFDSRLLIKLRPKFRLLVNSGHDPLLGYKQSLESKNILLIFIHIYPLIVLFHISSFIHLSLIIDLKTDFLPNYFLSTMKLNSISTTINRNFPTTGLITLPTQTMQYHKGNPSKNYHTIRIVRFPPRG